MIGVLFMLVAPGFHVTDSDRAFFGLTLRRGFDNTGPENLSAVYFGRKLEPKGRIVLHGAGQTDDPTFREYSALLGPSRPILYMSYIDLKDDLGGFFGHLTSIIASYPDYLIPQIGLSLNAGQASSHYELDVATGDLDDRIAALCSGLRSLGRPVYLRIGYEFNGQWNGYLPASYIAAFRRITLMLRTCSPETAVVWDFAPDGVNVGDNSSYMRFYPGDEYVDWWAINLFSEDSLNSQVTIDFLRNARAHRFPIMIGESTPRGHPVTEAQRVISGWYRPYFHLIRRFPQVKAFCYINWDWRQYSQWADWGDARIQDDPTVLAFYRHEVDGKLYQSAGDESATRRLLGLPPLPRRQPESSQSQDSMAANGQRLPCAAQSTSKLRYPTAETTTGCNPSP